ncbi:nuclear transport factor 2 family protein [Rhizobium leguminosarum]
MPESGFSRGLRGVYYNDEYVRQDGRWLISKRTSHFTWRDTVEMVAG